jgi:hypothetical protein
LRNGQVTQNRASTMNFSRIRGVFLVCGMMVRLNGSILAIGWVSVIFSRD